MAEPQDEGQENNLAQNAEEPYDANDPRQVAQRQTEHGRKQKRLQQTAKLILSQPNGREFLWELLAKCQVFSQEFFESDRREAFRAGERNVGIQLQNDLMRADRAMFLKMWEENGNG